MNQKAFDEVVAALNSGKITLDELASHVEASVNYIRRGNAYTLLTKDGNGVAQINGQWSNVYVAEGKPIERNGTEKVRKQRKPKGETNGA
jgi:hypothetical protein